MEKEEEKIELIKKYLILKLKCEDFSKKQSKEVVDEYFSTIRTLLTWNDKVESDVKPGNERSIIGKSCLLKNLWIFKLIKN